MLNTKLFKGCISSCSLEIITKPQMAQLTEVILKVTFNILIWSTACMLLFFCVQGAL